MKKLIFAVCLLLGATGTAHAITYDFNSIELEPKYNYNYKYYTETDFNSLFSGVSFHNTFDNTLTEIRFQIRKVTSDMEADFSGNMVMSYPWSNDGMTIATFDIPTDFVSVTMGDRGMDPDNLYLKAYDSSGSLIGKDFYENPGDSFAGRTLSVSTSSASIAWVEFYGIDWWGVNTVYWDNFTFNDDPSNEPDPDPAAIPEPGTLLLFGTGLSGVLVLVRKTLKKRK